MPRTLSSFFLPGMGALVAGPPIVTSRHTRREALCRPLCLLYAISCWGAGRVREPTSLGQSLPERRTGSGQAGHIPRPPHCGACSCSEKGTALARGPQGSSTRGVVFDPNTLTWPPSWHLATIYTESSLGKLWSRQSYLPRRSSLMSACWM